MGIGCFEEAVSKAKKFMQLKYVGQLPIQILYLEMFVYPLLCKRINTVIHSSNVYVFFYMLTGDHCTEETNGLFGAIG